MSTVTNQISESNYVHNDYNLSKLFILLNRFASATFKNNTGAGPSDFLEGTIVAIDTSDLTLVPWDNDVVANNASIPVGILRDDVLQLADAATVTNVWYGIKGDVAEELIIFNDGAQDMDDIIIADNRTVRQSLVAHGIIPVIGKDLTKVDVS